MSCYSRALNLLDCIATRTDLEAVQQRYPVSELPKNYQRWHRLRFRLFSTYRRLFTAVFTLNLIGLIIFLVQLRNGHHSFIVTPENCATGAAANFCVGVLMRNEHIVNGLFRIACGLPLSTPVCIRRYAAKIYSYGGVHSSCGVSGFLWYLTFCGLVLTQISFSARQGAAVDWQHIVLGATVGCTVIILIVILVFAHPILRNKSHNHFEIIHRYAGWTTIGFIWLQTVLLVLSNSKASHRSFGSVLIQTPTFWFLAIVTLCIIYPWTRLRLRSVHVEVLSDHATRLSFDYLGKIEAGYGLRLTHNPLMETHAFATIPNNNGRKGFSTLVSNAGDWTNDLIRCPRRRIFVKGAPLLGVMRIALLFKSVLVIATGSGIGPCMSLLHAPPEDLPRRPKMRVIWSAASPVESFGDNVVESVLQADSHAVIVDTKQTGRGNLLALSYSLFKDSGAEAAIIISNPVVTKKVVHGLEAYGIPAYGAIFDS